MGGSDRQGELYYEAFSCTCGRTATVQSTARIYIEALDPMLGPIQVYLKEDVEYVETLKCPCGREFMVHSDQPMLYPHNPFEDPTIVPIDPQLEEVRVDIAAGNVPAVSGDIDMAGNFPPIDPNNMSLDMAGNVPAVSGDNPQGQTFSRLEVHFHIGSRLEVHPRHPRLHLFPLQRPIQLNFLYLHLLQSKPQLLNLNFRQFKLGSLCVKFLQLKPQLLHLKLL
ncbi:hypothetical protein F4808DRAFT_470657 [Astrocystis sublimbata]|nr:hypothetical protein F4808DRAFT_470657 [Astrocystis sublimbata]